MGRSGDTPLARLADALVHGTGLALGTPFVSDGATAVVPILRTRTSPRRYILAGEAMGLVSATDRGRIDRLYVSNDSPRPVLLLPGTLFASDATAARATIAGTVMAPQTEAEVEVRCVHSSRALADGASLAVAHDLAPAWVMRALLTGDQGLVWARVRAYVAKSGPLSDTPSAPALDGLVAAIERTASDATQAPGGSPIQCGAILIDSGGVAAVECFDSPESWAASSSAILRRHESLDRTPPASPWTRSLDAAAAVRLARDFFARLTALPARQTGHGSWTALDASFAYTELEGTVLHLLAFGTPDSEPTVAAGSGSVATGPLDALAGVPPGTAAESDPSYPPDAADVAVASVPVADGDGEPESPEARAPPRRRKVLTSGWDDRTFTVLDHYARKEFRGDRSAAMRYLVRHGLRRRGYFGPLPSPAPTATAPEALPPSAELSRSASETRLHDLARIAETPIYAGWLRKRARLELERMIGSVADDLLRTAAQSIVDRLSPVEQERDLAPEAIPEPIPEAAPEAVEPSPPEEAPPPQPPPPPSVVDARATLREAFGASAMGDYRQAVSLFDQVLDEDRGNRTARLGRALALRRSGKSPEALADLDNILRMEPRNAAALLARGRILQERGDLPDALGVFDLLVDVAPNDWDVWMARGEVLAKMNRTEDALHAYRESLRRNPENSELEKRIRVLEASHPAPAPRTLPRPTLPREIEWGQSYLVREDHRERSPGLVRAIAALKVPVLVLTSRSRDLARRELGVGSARVLSLSFTPGEDHQNPTALASLTRMIERFIEDNQGHGVVLLDGLDDLVTNNGFRDTVLSVEHIHETVLQSRAIFLISIAPGDLGDKEVALLERSLRVIG